MDGGDSLPFHLGPISEGHLVMKFYLVITVVPLNRISSFNCDENAAVTANTTVEIAAVCEQLKN